MLLTQCWLNNVYALILNSINKKIKLLFHMFLSSSFETGFTEEPL